MDHTNSFGYWLRRRRKALDLTQDELARQAGCATATIKKIEADERRPSRQLAERFADLLAVPADERRAFLKAARAELASDRLAVATQPVVQPAGAAPPPQPAGTLPTGTVTFLFTDIAGSTRLWEQHPAAMPAALAQHDALLRAAIDAHGGAVFKTVGDAVCAAFATAADAASAVLAAQRALAAQPPRPPAGRRPRRPDPALARDRATAARPIAVWRRAARPRHSSPQRPDPP